VSTSKTIDLASQRPEHDAGVPHFHVVCARCGGAVRPGRLRCAVCSGEARESPPSTPAVVQPGSAVQFSIETLLLVTTLVAACLALGVVNPLLGICVSLLSLAALIRTTIIWRQHLRQGLEFLLADKVGWFVISLLIIFWAIDLRFVVFGAVVGFGSIVGHIPWEMGPPQTPAETLGYFLLGSVFWLSVLVGPLTAGVLLLCVTRPR
jgi:hypothetical protein